MKVKGSKNELFYGYVPMREDHKEAVQRVLVHEFSDMINAEWDGDKWIDIDTQQAITPEFALEQIEVKT